MCSALSLVLCTILFRNIHYAYVVRHDISPLTGVIALLALLKLYVNVLTEAANLSFPLVGTVPFCTEDGISIFTHGARLTGFSPGLWLKPVQAVLEL